VRQLRLRDIGGIIVIDFIDMANPKNRATVEEALQSELERDRTKTYVVEISPLGLVEMTRQNVTDGPREILTRKCTVCGGDGVVLSETSGAVDAERRLRELAATAPRTKAFKVELNAKVAGILIGPGASRLAAIEEESKRRFLIVGRDHVPNDHFEELGKGTFESLAPKGLVEEGTEIELKLVEVGLYDVNAGVGKHEGQTVVVGAAGGLVGKKAKVRIERVMDSVAYATLVGGTAKADNPITAEGEAEKPTRKPPVKKGRTPEPETEPEADAVQLEPEAEAERETEPDAEPVAADAETPAGPKKKTRRGSRGGKRRRKPAGATAAAAAAAAASNGEPPKEEPSADGQAEPAAPRIHLPDRELGGDEPEEEVAVPVQAENGQDGDEPPKPKKKTRRGSRGGRRRRKPAASSPSANSPSPPAE
jgi:ribonuclease G